MLNKASEGRKSLAVLIDADNVSAAAIDAMLSKISTLGYACVKRMYGDWTTPGLAAWKKVMGKHALQPIQQFAFTKGKNSTDGAMMIDAMDLMYTQRFDGFCICSSDSDFTRLAIRLREQGLLVYGFGEHKTPVSFVSACTEFTYIEPNKVADELESPAAPKASSTEAACSTDQKASSSQAPQPATASKSRAVTAGAKRAIRDAIEEGKDQTGWCNGTILGGKVNAKAFGCKKLMNLIELYPDHFEVEWRYSTRDTVNRSMYVRNKPIIKSVETHSGLH